MIIKRSLKSVMPSLKRCRLSESAAEDDESSGNRKKQKINGYYPLHLLGEVAAGIIPLSGFGLNRVLVASASETPRPWRPEVLCCPDEVEPKLEVVAEGMSNDRVAAEAPRPPLVRTSRGRIQVLPSRFNDSVLDNWKKEKSKSSIIRESNLDPEFIPLKGKNNSSKNPKPGGKFGNKDKFSPQCRKPSPLCEEETEEELGPKRFDIRKCYSTPCSSLRTLEEQLADVEKSPPVKNLEEATNCLANEQVERKSGICGTDGFVPGDIVWAISGDNYPAWPAIVLDPLSQAPQQVLSFRVAGAVCVMFFGYSGNGTQRDYAWIKRGMIFPFVEHVDRFQGQIDLNDSTPGDLRSAIEEAFLAEQGYTEMLMLEINAAAGNLDYLKAISRGIQEVTDSNKNRECNSQNQEAFKKKNARPCEGCGLIIPLKNSTEKVDLAPGGRQLCNTCARLTKLKQYCGICKKIWNRSDKGSWVRCDGCKVWVHAECDKIPSSRLKDLGKTDYYCPQCRAKFNFELSDSENCQPKVKQVPAIYVICNCSCGTTSEIDFFLI